MLKNAKPFKSEDSAIFCCLERLTVIYGCFSIVLTLCVGLGQAQVR